MNKRGARPQGKVNIQWSPKFAYAIGLLATDGNLSPDKRHINFTSKDLKLIQLFKRCLQLSNMIGRKAREREKVKRYYVLQFGDVFFYQFLNSIGLFPNKSKILASIKIPQKYFFHFLRGHFDGDGTFYSYFDPRWKSSFLLYTVFISASKKHIDWLRQELQKRVGIKGHISKAKTNSAYQLKYAKRESLKLLPKMYYDSDTLCLFRKREKIMIALRQIGETLV